MKPRPVFAAPGVRFVDTHTHSTYSHDGKSSLAEMRAAMSARGVDFAVTDHFDTELAWDGDRFSPILRAAEEAERLNRTPGAHIYHGVEIGEAIWNDTAADRILSLCRHDVVIGSIHSVRYPGWMQPFSLIDFRNFPAEKLDGYLSQYFTDLAETAETADYDILAHLTVPYRYLIGKFGLAVSPERFLPEISAILDTVIRRGKALEVNTSCLGSAYDVLMPDERILRLYREKGGRRLTIGSDAHLAENAAHAFESAKNVLLSIGFSELTYYENRRPIAYPIA